VSREEDNPRKQAKALEPGTTFVRLGVLCVDPFYQKAILTSALSGHRLQSFFWRRLFAVID
jgi:hypothetical protein